jgi:UDP-N-acetylmuramyl pentapeptide synthase
MTLAQAHALLPGSVLHGDGATRLARVHSDSRSLRAGDLFVALRGERFDGHDFLPGARAAGAAAALAEGGLGPALPGLQVADSLTALQQLAAAWRARCTLPLVAVTGSNGKTTVTQLVGAMLRAWLGEAALVTQGNLNNHIGVPLTLLRLRPAADEPTKARASDEASAPRGDEAPVHRAGVVELGMNHPGEIALLARIAAPTIALVNNAQREHLEFMRDVEAVARENGSVLAALPADGIAVLPAHDAYTPLWRELAGGRPVWTFGLDESADPEDLADDRAGGLAGDLAADRPSDRAIERSQADASDLAGDGCAPGAAPGAVGSGATGAPAAPRARGVTPPTVGGHALWQGDHWALFLRTPAGTATAALRAPGRHNVLNALAAATCALAAGAPLAAVVQGLQGFAPVGGRSQLQTLALAGGALTLVDDSYNANPDSVLAAIEVLAALPGPRWLILGDMGEVGEQGPSMHAEVGARSRACGIERFWAAGPLMAHADADRHFIDLPALLAALPTALMDTPAPRSLLVKGSRFMRMERVVQAVRDAALAQPQEGSPCC